MKKKIRTMASWSPNQSEPFTVSYMCHRQSSSVMLPKAALIPPCAATVCDLVGNYITLKSSISNFWLPKALELLEICKICFEDSLVLTHKLSLAHFVPDQQLPWGLLRPRRQQERYRRLAICFISLLQPYNSKMELHTHIDDPQYQTPDRFCQIVV